MARNHREDPAEADCQRMKSLPVLLGSNSRFTRIQEIPRYQEGLYDLKNGLYAWMVPNGSWGESNAGLIVGEGQSLLVDTLWDLKFTRTMLEANSHQHCPLRYVVNTHSGGDHFWGNQLVAGSEIITSRASRGEMMSTHPRSMLLLDKLGKLLSLLGCFGMAQLEHWLQGMGSPYDFEEITLTPATRTFEKQLVCRLEGGR